MRFAIIENGIVVNVVKADSPLAESWVESDMASPGDLYDDETFSKPAPATAPDPIAEARAKFAASIGVSVEGLNALIESIGGE